MGLQINASEMLGYPIGLHIGEVGLLLQYARKVPSDRVIIEVGTRNGGSALAMASVTECQVITIDKLEDPRYQDDMYEEVPPLPEHWANHGVADQIEQVTCISWEYKHDGRPVGMVFIDGDHETEAVRKDWETFSKLVETGGFVLFHDITTPGIFSLVQGLNVIDTELRLGVIQV